MHYVLVSACLLGQPVRYDGRAAVGQHAVLSRWLEEGRVLGVCPEVAGGLPVPRAPAEIEPGGSGARVLQGLAVVVDNEGNDVSAAFVAGATHARAIAQKRGLRVAVLKEGSPSCGSGYIYDGSFSRTTLAQMGVTAASLTEVGVRVFSEHQWDEAQAFLADIEAENDN